MDLIDNLPQHGKLQYRDRDDTYDQDFFCFLQEMVSSGELEDPAEGITKQVIDKGIVSLSEKQRYVFNRYVLKKYVIEDCSRCSNGIPWSEMYEARDNGGYCGWCSHMMGRIMEE